MCAQGARQVRRQPLGWRVDGASIDILEPGLRALPAARLGAR
jgi:hypothetical protein